MRLSLNEKAKWNKTTVPIEDYKKVCQENEELKKQVSQYQEEILHLQEHQ